jgi:hypothetical protein
VVITLVEPTQAEPVAKQIHLAQEQQRHQGGALAVALERVPTAKTLTMETIIALEMVEQAEVLRFTTPRSQLG